MNGGGWEDHLGHVRNYLSCLGCSVRTPLAGNESFISVISLLFYKIL